jgi:hypothetical protein
MAREDPGAWCWNPESAQKPTRRAPLQLGPPQAAVGWLFLTQSSPQLQMQTVQAPKPGGIPRRSNSTNSGRNRSWWKLPSKVDVQWRSNVHAIEMVCRHNWRPENSHTFREIEREIEYSLNVSSIEMGEGVYVSALFSSIISARHTTPKVKLSNPLAVSLRCFRFETCRLRTLRQQFITILSYESTWACTVLHLFLFPLSLWEITHI